MSETDIINFEIKGLNETIDSYQQKGNQIYSKIIELNTRMLNAFHQWVQREAPHKTGRLKSAVFKSNYRTGGSVYMGNGAPYFHWVLDGTRPHLIQFRNKQALFWKGAAHPVKSVHHPGTKANPYFDKGYESGLKENEVYIRQFEDWLES